MKRTKVVFYFDQDLDLDVLGELVDAAIDSLCEAISNAGGNGVQSYADGNCTRIGHVNSKEGNYTVRQAEVRRVELFQGESPRGNGMSLSLVALEGYFKELDRIHAEALTTASQQAIATVAAELATWVEEARQTEIEAWQTERRERAARLDRLEE